jgi:hypothetical protein
MSDTKVIAVDLDGTLAYYDGFRGHAHIGEPILNMVAIVKTMLDFGHQVWIYTSRVAPFESWMEEMKWTEAQQAERMRETHEAIRNWCVKHIGRELPITATKWRTFHEFWDDRAVYVPKNGEYQDITMLQGS